MYVELEWLLNFCVLMVFNENLSKWNLFILSLGFKGPIIFPSFMNLKLHNHLMTHLDLYVKIFLQSFHTMEWQITFLIIFQIYISMAFSMHIHR